MNYQPYMYGYQQPNIYPQPFGYQQQNAQPIKNPQTEQYNQPQQPQQVQQPQQMYKQALFLQGKSVDSVDVVKAMDIPLDGTISYFPLTDGTAIVTKQLQQDGTSKTIVYKPISENEKQKEEKKYITQQDLDNAIGNIDLSDIEELKEDFDEFKKELKDIKSKLKSKGD